jgi:sugar lactone lactonase YvrE
MAIAAAAGRSPAEPLRELWARRAGSQGGAAVFDLDLRSLAGAGMAANVHVRDVPLGPQRDVDLLVARFSVTGPGTRFVVGPGDRPLAGFDPSGVTLLRGSVAGEPGSRAFLALSRHGSAGSIDLGPGGERFGVSSLGAPAAGRLAIFERGTGALDLPAVPVCALEARSAPPGAPPRVAAAAGGPDAIRSIELAVETDYEYFSLFADAEAAAAYVVQLYGAVSDIYLRDVGARIELAFVRLWDTPDDLFDDPDPLGPFVDWWNRNMAAVERDAAQFLTGRRDLPYGGVAYLEALCTDFAYSVAGYTLGSFPSLDSPGGGTWDVIVTAHELGHNCGTLHTHDYDIDACASGELQRGTIMSYCHTLPGGNANIDLYFHAITGSIMKEFIGGASCLHADCNGNGVDDAIDIGSGSSADVDLNGVPDECEDCNGNGALDGADISGGASRDANGNGVPDECEPDCNGNSIPDDLDILLGKSQDLHGDGVPDECDADCDGDGASDYNEIQQEMSLDVDRTATLDACQDCDGDGTADWQELSGAHNLWVASEPQNVVSQMHAGSGVLVLTTAPGGVSAPYDVLVRSDGRVLVSGATGHHVVQFDADGSNPGTFVAPGSGGLVAPAGMAWTPQGNLLVASSGNHRVLEYDGLTGGFIGAFVPAGLGGLSGPRGLRYGPNSNLFVSTADDRVLEYDGADGSFVGTFVAASSGGLAGARGLVFTPDANLLVASSASNRILEYDGSTGAPLGQWDHGGLDTGFWALLGPWDLEIGPDGNVYVTSSDGNAAVHKYDVASGNFMRSFYVLASAGPLQGPTGLGFVPGETVDCNLNLVPDSCDIDSGSSSDVDGNGVPDECEPVPGDLDGDGAVGITDLLGLLAAWGPCPGPCPPRCGADLDGDCQVGIVDLLTLLANWT